MRRQIEQYVSYPTFQLAVFENFNKTMKHKIKGNQLRGISRLCKGKKKSPNTRFIHRLHYKDW